MKMRTMMLALLLVAFCAVASAAVTVQDQQPWVTVLISGKPVMGFAPAAAPYKDDGPGVCSEVGSAEARTKDGLPIRALDFIGWKEGDGYRVMVFAVVPAKNRAGAGTLCGEGSGYKRVDFASIHIKQGQELRIEKMKEAGMTPWTIRASMKDR